MTNQAISASEILGTQETRRKLWANTANSKRYSVSPGQKYPRIYSIVSGKDFWTFCGIGISLMLSATAEQWHPSYNQKPESSYVLYVIDDTTERLCEYYGLSAQDVDWLFGDDDIQLQSPLILANRLLAFDYLSVPPRAVEDATSQVP